MTFGAPWLLALFILLVPVAGALLWLARWRGRAVRRMVRGAGVAPVSAGRRLLKAGLLLTALALIAVAAARPQIGSRRVLLPREGTDVIIVLDVSASMLAADVEPNRFDRAKSVLNGLLDRLQGDRVGLVVFAGSANLRFPLTTDIAVARQLVRASVIKEGGLAAGTGIGDAVRLATASFATDSRSQSKVIVIVSDGEDLTGSPADAVRDAREANILVHTIGIGTADGSTISVPARGSNRTELRLDPRTGQPSITRRDEDILRALASSGKGRYVDGNSDDASVEIAEDVSRLARSRFESQEGSLPIDRYHWPAAAALLLLSIEFLIADTARRRAARRTATVTPQPAGAVGGTYVAS